MTWEQLVSTALLGTERRPVEPTAWGGRAAALAGRPPADALLGAAALVDAERVARGSVPPGAPGGAAPAAADEVPAAGPRAAPRLSALLHGRDRDLVEAVLRDLVAAGRRVPDECLPALLDVATRSVLPAELVGPVLGRRGRWLAGFRPEWATAVAWLTDDRPDAPEEAEADPAAWLLGTTANRVQWLVRARRRAPGAARDTLAAGWTKEKLADRVMFVEALATGLHAEDEAFLEVALTDRSDRVRQAARTLLLALPGSRLHREAVRRAADWVGLETGPHQPLARIVVTPPVFGAREPQGHLDDLVRTLVAAVPLSTWVPRLGQTPAEVVGRPVDERWRPVLHRAWLAAAQRERDADWGHALLAGASAEHRDDVLPLVPAEVRYSLVASWLRAGPVARPAALLQACPAPWPDELTAAVLGIAGLDHPAGSGLHGRNHSDQGGLSNTVGRLAGLRANPGYADAVHRAADALDPDHPDQHHLATMGTLLANRRRLLEEIA